MRRIYKYQLNPQMDKQSLHMPEGAEVMSIGVQGEAICVWAMVQVDPTPVASFREFIIKGTGMEIDFPWKAYKFLGTVQMKDGLVWHVWMSEC